MANLEYVRAYLDDLLVLTKGSFEEHLEKLNEVLQHLKATGLQVNAKKSSFGHPEVEYLGYKISRNGSQPLTKKVEAIQKTAVPKTKKQLRHFIGMINYYRDMWIRRSETLAPLASLCSTKTKWKWTEVHQQAFEKIKRTLSKEVLLAYPDFSKPFEIHTDASNLQLGAVIAHKMASQ